MKSMTKTLSEHPVIGIASGLLSSLILALKDFFTDEGILYVIQILGVWLGILIVILTAMIKIIELFGMIRREK